MILGAAAKPWLRRQKASVHAWTAGHRLTVVYPSRDQTASAPDAHLHTVSNRAGHIQQQGPKYQAMDSPLGAGAAWRRGAVHG